MARAKVTQETAALNLERSRLLEADGLVSRRELELAIQTEIASRAEVKALKPRYANDRHDEPWRTIVNKLTRDANWIRGPKELPP